MLSGKKQNKTKKQIKSRPNPNSSEPFEGFLGEKRWRIHAERKAFNLRFFAFLCVSLRLFASLCVSLRLFVSLCVSSFFPLSFSSEARAGTRGGGWLSPSCVPCAHRKKRTKAKKLATQEIGRVKRCGIFENETEADDQEISKMDKIAQSEGTRKWK